MEDHPILEGKRFATCERLGQQDVRGVEDIGDLPERPAHAAAALANLERQVGGVEAERDTVQPVDDRLDHVQGALALRHPVRTKVMMIMQGEGLVLERAKRGRPLGPHGTRPGLDPGAARPLPQPPEQFRVVAGEAERLDEQAQRRLAEHPARDRAKDGVLELARQHIDVTGGTGIDARDSAPAHPPQRAG